MLLSAMLVAAAIAQSPDGVAIRYTDQGKGEPALVFVHCWSCDRTFWDGQAAVFSGDHRVVALDLAGHGESGRNRKAWTVEAFAGDVRAVVEKLALKRVVLIGSSMGGEVVLEAARTLGDRVAGLVVVDILTDVGQGTPPEQIDAAVRRFQEDYRGEAARYIDQYLFSKTTPPDVRRRVLDGALKAPPEVSIPALRAAMEYDPVPAFRELKVPMHAINSDLFPTNVEGNRKFAPQFQAVIIPGSGHYPLLEHTARFNELLADAIREGGKR